MDPSAAAAAHRPGCRPLVPAALILALAALLATALPVSAATRIAFPIQSLGDRGTDVQAIQLLLRARGAQVVADGRFSPATEAAVRVFQRQAGVSPSGIVGTATWLALAPPRLAAGATGDAVRALQVELNAKRRAGLAVDGRFDAADRAAVRAFQAHSGLAATGVVTGTTWKALAWHYEYPRFTAGRLCDYSVGNGLANWGTAEMAAVLRYVSIAVSNQGYGAVAVGDVSFEHGGLLPGHESHRVGLDADFRAIRTDRRQCAVGGSYRLRTYDRAATRALVLAIRAAAPGHLKLVWFNDPQLIAEGLTVYHAGHDDHLHVRLCEAFHAVSAYDC